MSNFLVETTKHSTVAMTLVAVLSFFGFDNVKAFAVEQIKDEVNKELTEKVGKMESDLSEIKGALQVLVRQAAPAPVITEAQPSE